MIKNNTKKGDDSNRRKSIVRSIPIDLDRRWRKLGGGNWKSGAYKAIDLAEQSIRDPAIPILYKLDELGNLIKSVAPENHLDHYVESGLPILLRKFAKTGEVDKKILFSKRPEKAIDKFLEEDDKDAEKPE